MEIFLIRLLQFVLAISLLVLLHEGGHFAFAKLFGVRVEKFYLFFDPWFHLIEIKPKNSPTAYGVGWLPLGGYCKIAGMIDESFDTKQMSQPVQHYEFRAKPAWQRLLIMVGGVLVNFIVALVIYSMVLFTWGEKYYSVPDMTHGMQFNSQGHEVGFRDGDILIGTDAVTFDKYGVQTYRDMANAKSITVMRGRRMLKIAKPEELGLIVLMMSDPVFCTPLMPSDIDSVLPGSPAHKAGMLKGDRIVAVNGHSVNTWPDVDSRFGRLRDKMAQAQSHGDSLAARQAEVAVVRSSGAIDTLSMTLNSDLTMGVLRTALATYYKPKTTFYNFWESIPAGVAYGCEVLGGYVDDMKYLFTADGAKQIGGFGSIGSLFPPVWDWQMFWTMTAFLSIILAFMNILPIPALDGGHVLFLLYEMVTRRKPGERFLVIAEYVGFGLLILLMVVANLNDILRWLGVM